MLDKMLTARYPLGVILMELAHQMKLRRTLLRARWLPRLQNQEADDLTNDEFRHFDLSIWIHVDLKSLDFKLMESLFEVGDDYIAELDAAKASEKKRMAKRVMAGDCVDARKNKRVKGLMETDPWK